MKAFVQIHTDYMFYNENYFNAWRAFNWLGYEVIKFKQFEIPADLTRETPVFASVQQTKMIFQKLGIKHEEFPSYPESLEYCLGRKFGIDTTSNINKRVNEGEKLFVKPLDKNRKRFDGFVAEKDTDFIAFCGKDFNEKVYWSEVKNIVHEVRVFIHKNKVMDIRPYRGVPFTELDSYLSKNVILTAIKNLVNPPVAYCLDFGILDTRETLLVEATDAWAFGHYGLNFVDYGNMIIDRWNEIVNN